MKIQIATIFSIFLICLPVEVFPGKPWQIWGGFQKEPRCVLDVDGISYIGGNFLGQGPSHAGGNSLPGAREQFGVFAVDQKSGEQISWKAAIVPSQDMSKEWWDDSRSGVYCMAADGERLFLGGAFLEEGSSAHSKMNLA